MGVAQGGLKNGLGLLSDLELRSGLGLPEWPPHSVESSEQRLQEINK